MQIYSIWFKYTLKEMLIIGIAGGTGSGKTTVVRKIVESLPAGEVVVLPQDSYYKDSSHVPVEERQNINFDHPDAFEWSLLSKHVMMLKEAKSIEEQKKYMQTNEYIEEMAREKFGLVYDDEIVFKAK